MKDIPTKKAKFTPLHIACTTENYISTVSFLAASKVDINAKDARGQSPLHLAAKYGPLNNVIKMLGSS